MKTVWLRLRKLWFNGAYYVGRYPDVRVAGVDPFSHYLEYGMSEGRYPNRTVEQLAVRRAQFAAVILATIFLNKRYYLRTYPDVAQSGLDPRIHFRRFGYAEGRQWRNPARLWARYAFMRQLSTAARLGFESDEQQLAYERTVVFGAAARGARLWLALWAYKCEKARTDYGRKSLGGIYKVTPPHRIKGGNCHLHRISPSKPMSFREPSILSSNREPAIRTVNVPEQWICTAKDAVVIGGFQVLHKKELLLYEPAAHPNKGFVAGIWQYVAAIRGTQDRVVVKFDYKECQYIEEAILLSGRCSPNYYHWLIEYLGKAHLLARAPELCCVPLIVDADMPAAEFESLELVLQDWPLVRVSRSTLLQVGKLHIPSVGTYLPDNLNDAGWKGGALSFDMLAFLRARVLSALNLSPTAPNPRRVVFLTRRWGRNLTNGAELEDVARRFGSEIVDPSVLSFSEQVRLFHDAELLIGAMGASFTNLIFCRPGTHAMALSSPFTQNFCVHNNLALFAGVQYSIIVGEHPRYEDGDEDTNRDINLYLDSFSVDPAKLEAALLAWHGAKKAGNLVGVNENDMEIAALSQRMQA